MVYESVLLKEAWASMHQCLGHTGTVGADLVPHAHQGATIRISTGFPGCSNMPGDQDGRESAAHLCLH